MSSISREITWEPPGEPPWGIEPQTYALREARETVPGALPALIAAHLPRNALNTRRARGPRSMTRSTAGQSSR